jgi:predicted  nucleic acid-binding Zn-ribbon protein
MNAEPAQVMARLDDLACELDTRSKRLAEVERGLSGYRANDGSHVTGVEESYEDWADTWMIGKHEQYEADGKRLPTKEMLERMMRKEMPAQLLGTYRELRGERERLKRRIGDIKAQVEAQRSILSAAKQEMEATAPGLRGAA